MMETGWWLPLGDCMCWTGDASVVWKKWGCWGCYIGLVTGGGGGGSLLGVGLLVIRMDLLIDRTVLLASVLLLLWFAARSIRQVSF